MSTRACYTFKDGTDEFHVYKHHDGYPTGAAEHISNALKNAWPLPRFEADEFAAAFVATNKTHDGGVRLMHSGKIQEVAPSDIEYRYEIEVAGKDLQITAFETRYWGDKQDETRIWQGPLAEMLAWAEKAEAAE